MSPLLFDLASDVLAIMIERAVDNGLLRGLSCHLLEKGVPILQYADDTILLLQDNLEQARNFKFILCLFEQMSGLKINFHKSEVYCIGTAATRKDSYERIFTCQVGQLPMMYLGVPIDEIRLKNSDWDSTGETLEKKLGCWNGKNLSIGGRTLLINTSLSSSLLYMMSFYRIPVEKRKDFDKLRSGFLWSGKKEKKKYHLVNWKTVCQPKDQGVWGFWIWRS